MKKKKKKKKKEEEEDFLAEYKEYSVEKQFGIENEEENRQKVDEKIEEEKEEENNKEEIEKEDFDENLEKEKGIDKKEGNEKDKLKFNLNELFDEFNLDGNDIFIKDNNILYQITSSKNQINNKHKNISSINLGECESRLKKHIIHKQKKS